MGDRAHFSRPYMVSGDDDEGGKRENDDDDDDEEEEEVEEEEENFAKRSRAQMWAVFRVLPDISARVHISICG